MAILSLLLGFGGGDLANTFNEFRGYLGYLAAALYFSTVVLDRQIRERLAVAWLGAGIALGAVILVRWAGRLAGTDLGLIDRTYDAAIRVLNGPSSFFVASAGLVLLLPALESWASRPRLQRYTGIALLVMAIILNRRTVWLALVMALVILLARRGQVGRRLALVAAVGLVLFLALIPVLTEPEAEQSVAAAITDTGTLAWRIEGWTALLETGPDSAPERLIGEPFGSGFQRDIRGNVRESNPHSFYVQTYLRTGVIGLGALVAALWIGFTGAFRAGKDEAVPLSNEHLLVLLAMQAIWFLAWPPGPDQGIILGLAVASAAMSSQSALEERRAKLAVG
jgi:O-antigen ligase